MPRCDVSMTASEVEAFLDQPRTAVLSTLGIDGGPHVAAMWFFRDDRRIVMWAYRKSQKAVNAVRDPRAALVVEDGSDYGDLRGVLIRGRLEVIESLEAVSAIGLRLFDRYSGPVAETSLEMARLEVERQAPKRVGLVLPMTRVGSWDHRKIS